MKKGFKKIDNKKLTEKYGGFGWGTFALALIPFAINSITQAVASIKMLNSSKGSVKFQGYESHWDEKATKADTSKHKTDTFVYVY